MENVEKLYTKVIDGVTITKRKNQIVVIKGDFQYINPNEELLFEDGWTVYNPISNFEPEKIEEIVSINVAKEKKYREISAYDASSNVNQFMFNGYPIWLDKATRVGLKLRIEAELMNEKYVTSLWYNGNEFTLPTEYVQKMLYAVEVYASQCYDNTQQHILNVGKLETVEDVENYDITTNYPEQLVFRFDM
jgi:hypothetical protein